LGAGRGGAGKPLPAVRRQGTDELGGKGKKNRGPGCFDGIGSPHWKREQKKKGLRLRGAGWGGGGGVGRGSGGMGSGARELPGRYPGGFFRGGGGTEYEGGLRGGGNPGGGPGTQRMDPSAPWGGRAGGLGRGGSRGPPRAPLCRRGAELGALAPKKRVVSGQPGKNMGFCLAADRIWGQRGKNKNTNKKLGGSRGWRGEGFLRLKIPEEQRRFPVLRGSIENQGSTRWESGKTGGQWGWAAIKKGGGPSRHGGALGSFTSPAANRGGGGTT